MAEDKKKPKIPSRSRSARIKSGRIKRTRKSGRVPKASGRSPRQPAAAVAGDAQSFRVICSECYEEFFINPEKEVETFNCPDCDHPAKGPNKDFLGKLNMVKKREKKNLIISVAAMLVSIVAFLLWQVVTINPANETGTGYAFIGLFVIGALVSIIFGVMYETKRYEIYF